MRITATGAGTGRFCMGSDLFCQTVAMAGTETVGRKMGPWRAWMRAVVGGRGNVCVGVPRRRMRISTLRPVCNSMEIGNGFRCEGL